MELLMVAGIVTMLLVSVAVAKRQIKRRSSKSTGATRLSTAVAAKVLPLEVKPLTSVAPALPVLPPKTLSPEVKPLASEPPVLTVQPLKVRPPEFFRKEQALLAASQGCLDRSQLLLILDNARRMGLSAVEVSVFEAALNIEGPSPAKAIRRISYPEPASNKNEQVNPPQDERVPYTTYVPHNSPPVIVPATKRKPSSLPLEKGSVGGSIYSGYRAAGESLPRRTQNRMPLPVKPHVRQEGKTARSFVWPTQTVSVPVSSPANANSEPLSDAEDTTLACRSCGECFSSKHELRAHRCVLMSAENRGPEPPCGGCGRCYACRYLRITRGE
jgi:hypothetical protein